MRMSPSAARPLAGIVMFAAVAAGIAGVAQAMRVSPMVIEMTTKGGGATARLEVQNLNQTQLAFETRVTRIDYDAQGNMVETPADGDFLIFPPQGVLAPGSRQVVRLQWLGEGELDSSRGYYVSVNQLPVKLAAGDPGAAPGAQVQVVYNMKALVVVAPPNAEPKVAVVSTKPVMIEPKADPAPVGAPPTPTPTPAAVEPPAPGVEVVVRNTGKRYAMMAGAKWTIQGTGADGKPLTVTLTQEDLNREIGVGYVAALTGQRTFRVRTGARFAAAPISVRFSQ